MPVDGQSLLMTDSMHARGRGKGRSGKGGRSVAPRMTVDHPVAVRGALAQQEQSRPSPMCKSAVGQTCSQREPHWWVLMCLHMCRGKGQCSSHRLQCELCDKSCRPACAARMNGEESAPDVMPVDGQEQQWRCPVSIYPIKNSLIVSYCIYRVPWRSG